MSTHCRQIVHLRLVGADRIHFITLLPSYVFLDIGPVAEGHTLIIPKCALTAGSSTP